MLPTLFKRFLLTHKGYFWEQRKAITFVSFLVFLLSVIGSINPFVFGTLIDSIDSGLRSQAISLMTLYLVINVAKSLISRFEVTLSARLTAQVSNQIKYRVFCKVIRLKRIAFDQYTDSEIVNRIEGTTQISVAFIINLIKSAALIIINIVVSLYVMLRISIFMTIVSIVVLPLTLVVTITCRKLIQRAREEILKNNDKYLSYIYMALKNIDGIRSFRAENTISSFFFSALDTLVLSTLKQIKINENVKLCTGLIVAIFNFVILYISACLIWDSVISIGDLVSFVLYLTMLLSTLTTIYTLCITFNENNANLIRFFELDDLNAEEDDSTSVRIGLIKSIDVNRLAFSYRNDITPLKEISLSINSSGLYSFVGANGSGKTTLLKLLLKFYESDYGQIIINNIPIGTISYDSLRSQFVYIAKYNFCLDDTIENNIKISNSSASDEDIMDALKMVGLDSYILSLNDGIKTVIGSNGIQMSSGQMQRLMLSRVFLTNASVILLDEVTSDIDSISEYEIVKAIRCVAKDRIVISISHRQSFIEISDKVFFFNNGSIEFQGRHDELIGKYDLYKSYFNRLTKSGGEIL